MGYSPGLLDVIIEWAKQFDIRPGRAVLDIGTQELFCAEDPSALNRFLTHFGAEPYGQEELDRMADRAFAAGLFQRAGSAYKAVDIGAYPHTLRIDLNTGRLPFRHRRRYAFVANCGTTEHVLNQLNAFRLVHDACAVGGLMYHGVPMAGMFEHGLISYSPKFFVQLVAANGYETVDLWGHASGEPSRSEMIEPLHWNQPFKSQTAMVNVLLRRTSAAGFKAPSDCVDHVRIA